MLAQSLTNTHKVVIQTLVPAFRQLYASDSQTVAVCKAGLCHLHPSLRFRRACFCLSLLLRPKLLDQSLLLHRHLLPLLCLPSPSFILP